MRKLRTGRQGTETEVPVNVILISMIKVKVTRGMMPGPVIPAPACQAPSLTLLVHSLLSDSNLAPLSPKLLLSRIVSCC